MSLLPGVDTQRKPPEIYVSFLLIFPERNPKTFIKKQNQFVNHCVQFLPPRDLKKQRKKAKKKKLRISDIVINEHGPQLSTRMRKKQTENDVYLPQDIFFPSFFFPIIYITSLCTFGVTSVVSPPPYNKKSKNSREKTGKNNCTEKKCHPRPSPSSLSPNSHLLYGQTKKRFSGETAVRRRGESDAGGLGARRF